MRRVCPYLISRLLGILLLGMGIAPLAAAPLEARLQFDHISYVDGLVNSAVSSILQDDSGFLWFGTQAGLQRYDGYTMTLYTSEPFNPGSLSHQLVQTLYLDSGDVIWVGTYGGLNRLDPITNRITHFRHSNTDAHSLSNDVVTSVARDASGTLWAGTLDGLNRLDSEEEKRFTRFVAGEDDRSLPNATVRRVFLDSSDRLWVGTYGGLSLVEYARSGEVEFRTVADGPDGLPSPYVMSIAEDEAGRLWVGTWDGGVSRVSAAGTVETHYRFPDNRVYQVLPARSGLVYLAIWGGGLVILDPDTGDYTVHRPDVDDSYSLAHDIAYSLYEDRTGIIWIGTNGNGISKYDPGRRDFRFVHPELPEHRRLSIGRVQMLHEDRATGRLYIGVQNSGLNVRDPDTGRVTIHRHDPDDPTSIGHDNVTAALTEPDGSILLGTNAGISRYNPRTGDFESAWGPFADVAGDDPQIVYALMRARDDSIWVGTYDRGLLRRKPDGTVVSYRYDPEDPGSLSNNLVYAIYEDSRGVIWVATNGGLNRYLPEVDGFRHYLHDPENPRSISSNSTAQMLEDSAGTLWIASRSGGLIRYRRQTDDFDFIGTAHGLSSNLVASLLEVAPGVIYVATTNGLNRIDLDPVRVTTIDERDGLNVREFAGGALRTSDGEHLFGAFSTIIRVPPARSPVEGHEPDVRITAISVMNEPYERGLAPHAVREISLPHARNFISFEFAAMEFSVPRRNRYRYRLVGLDPEWVDAGYRRTADYTALPPGRYTFEVLGADSRGAWSPEPTRVAVEIVPPFWRTSWFTVLSLLLLAAAVIAVVLVRTRTLQVRARELEALVAERTAALKRTNTELAAANSTRERLFSIIAHDLRNPITGVAGIMRRVVRDFGAMERHELEEISRVVATSAGGLESMLDNLLEWSQLQLEAVEQRSQRLSVDELVSSVVDAYRSAAHTKSLGLRHEPTPGLTAQADSHALKTILANLLSNAVKFTPQGGTVTVASTAFSSEGEPRVAITVQDTGVGIPPEQLDAVFELASVYRTTGTQGERGSGLGLTLCRDLVERLGGTITIDSHMGEGTVVTVELPG